MINLNKIGFLLIGLVVFTLILLKMLMIPMTHDEVPTALMYSKYSFWDIMMYPDNTPNNHILNTLLVKVSIAVFGIEQWSVRLPSLLSFIVYLAGVYRVLKYSIGLKSRFFIPAILLFVCNLYLLDFYSLSRGYGISTAFCVLSISYLLSGFIKVNSKHVFIAVISAMLSAYANFTTLYFGLTIILFSGIYFLIYGGSVKQKLTKLSLLVLVFVGFFALIMVPIQKMQNTDQFVFWTSNGFFKESVEPMIHHSLYWSNLSQYASTFAILISAVFFFSLSYHLVKIFQRKYSLQNPLLLTSALLAITILVNIVHQKLTGTPNLNGRTALFFYPMFLVVCISVLNEFKESIGSIVKWGISIIIVISCVWHVKDRYKFDRTREWSYGYADLQVVDYIHRNNPKNKPFLEMSWFFYPSLSFYNETEELPVEIGFYHKDYLLESDAKYYYVPINDTNMLMPKYHVDTLFEMNALMRLNQGQ